MPFIRLCRSPHLGLALVQGSNFIESLLISRYLLRCVSVLPAYPVDAIFAGLAVTERPPTPVLRDASGCDQAHVGDNPLFHSLLPSGFL